MSKFSITSNTASVLLALIILCYCPTATAEKRFIEALRIADASMITREGVRQELKPIGPLDDPEVEIGIRKTASRAVKTFGLENTIIDLIMVDDAKEPGYSAAEGRLDGQTKDRYFLLFGRKFTDVLLRNVAVNDGRPKAARDATAVSGAIGHEVAHLYQFREGIWDRLLADDSLRSVRRAELHADLLAGWFLGRNEGTFIKLEGVDLFAAKLANLGNFRSTEPSHHGTPSQRYAAMLKGFFLGRDLRIDLAQASQQGEEFVEQIVQALPEK